MTTTAAQAIKIPSNLSTDAHYVGRTWSDAWATLADQRVSLADAFEAMLPVDMEATEGEILAAQYVALVRHGLLNEADFAGAYVVPAPVVDDECWGCDGHGCDNCGWIIHPKVA